MSSWMMRQPSPLCRMIRRSLKQIIIDLSRERDDDARQR